MATEHVNMLMQFVGGKIELIAHDSEKEYFGFVICLKDGSRKTILFLRDDEGNGPGGFDISAV